MGATMKIKSVKLNELGNLKNINIDFGDFNNNPEEPFNFSVIVGENGTGKTTLLRFLSMVFFKNAKLKTPLPSEYSIQYSIDGNPYSIDQDSDIEGLPGKIVVSTYSPFEQYDYVGPKSYSEQNIRYKYVGTRVESVRGSIQKSPTTILMPLLRGLFSSDDDKRHAMVQLLNEIGYTSPIVELASIKIGIKKTFGLKLKRKVEKLNEFHAINQLDGFPKMFKEEILKTYKGGVSAWLNDMSAVKFYKKEIIKSMWFHKKGIPVNILDMSSGELSILFRFVSILDEIEHNSLVIVDEPEIHLHPRWLMKYFGLTYSVFKNYRAHFIFASHSPLIAADVPKESIVGLKYDEVIGRVVQFQVKNNTLGAESTEILENVFLIENEVGGFTSLIIKKIRENIEQGNITEAEKLYKALGESDVKFKLFKEIRQKAQALED
jgi:Cdc6-like AAA superfamily ATPase